MCRTNDEKLKVFFSFINAEHFYVFVMFYLSYNTIQVGSHLMVDLSDEPDEFLQ